MPMNPDEKAFFTTTPLVQMSHVLSNWGTLPALVCPLMVLFSTDQNLGSPAQPEIATVEQGHEIQIRWRNGSAC